MADEVIQTSIARPAPYLEAAGETILETALGKKMLTELLLQVLYLNL